MKDGSILDVFDTKEDRYFMQDATRDEIAEKLNVTKVSINHYLVHDYKVKRRYILLRPDDERSVQLDASYPRDLLEEWDEIRLRINPGARRY